MTLSALTGRVTFEQEVKKSRFIVHAAPVGDPESALAFLAQVADAQATHNCWAYRIGAAYRFSDDGEPAGTAGRPILQALDGQAIDQAMVVVTRHFGGIKLGAGGLVRAYGGSAAECLRRATKISIIQMVMVTISCAFSAMGAVHNALAHHGARKLTERFDSDGAILDIEIAAEHLPVLTQAVADVTRGQGEVKLLQS